MLPIPPTQPRSTARRRGGSVLILVIALLVMLALIGTAFLTTARQDSTAAAVGSSNTQLDLLGNDAADLATGAIVSDLFAGPNPSDYRKPTPINPMPAANAPGYHNWDSPVTDTFLASRTPVGPAATPRWEWITGPLSTASNSVIPAFEDPTSSTLVAWTDRQNAFPGFAGSQPTLTVASGTHAAADADGDGVADSGYIRLGSLPGAKFAGLTFYAGIRVVDGNSALNLSTAWESTTDWATTAAATPARNNRIFPTSIGLQELLTNPAYHSPVFGDSVDVSLGGGGLNSYRFNFANGGADLLTTNTINPLADYDPANPAQRNPKARADFAWTSQMDWYWNELGRRLDFPGYNHVPPLGTPALFRGLPLSDTLSLAYPFGLRHTTGQAAIAEQTLPHAMGVVTGDPNFASSVPYTALGNWFNTFDPTNPAFNLRTISVTRNPVSNAAPVHRVSASGLTDVPAVPDGYTGAPSMGRYDYNYRGVWNSGTAYQQGDVVVYNDTSIPTDARPYVAITAIASGLAAPNTNASWRYQPWSAVPTRVDANKAGFDQLWQAYWNVMADTAVGPPPTAAAPFASPATPAQIFQGNRWTVTAGSNTYNNVAVPNHPNRMFRSPIRDCRATTYSGSTGVVLPPDQVAILRSALAALNTVDYRTAVALTPTVKTINNLSVQIYSGAGSTPTPVRAVLFGNKQQPFITEVYVSTDITNDQGAGKGANTDWYVAIKLYNPYPNAINVSGWTLDTLDRSAGATADKQTVGTAVGPIPSGSVPPNGFLILENYDPTGSSTLITHRPPSSGLAATGAIGNSVYIPTTAATGLCAATLSNHELIIRQPIAGAPEAMPIDSFDFSGIAAGSAGANNVYHYVRQDTQSRFVYPGRFDGAPQATLGNGELFHQEGLQVYTYNSPDQDLTAAMSPPAALSTSSALATYPTTFAIPLRNYGTPYTGLPGPNPVGAGVNAYPFGGFARQGDLLQVPFIGSYVIDDPSTSQVYEMNGISADSAMAEDTDTTDDLEESIGRFCPITPPATSAANPAVPNLDEFGNNSAGAGDQFRYGWAGRLFDYLTVSSPQDDYTPDVDPVQYTAAGGTQPAQPTAHNAQTFAQTTIANGASTAGTDGLVNINTAPLAVLAAVPWTRTPLDNLAIANAIVAYRQGTYPATSPNAPGANGLPARLFHNIFELNLVPATTLTAAKPGTYGGDGFRNILGDGTYNYDLGTNPVTFKTHDNGDFTPWTTGSPFPGTNGSNEAAGVADTLAGDYKAFNFALTAVSNLITTRSDTFTVYVVVEGWENAGTASAKRVMQRHYAFWVDRNNVTPTNRTPVVVPIPTSN